MKTKEIVGFATSVVIVIASYLAWKYGGVDPIVCIPVAFGGLVGIGFNLSD